MSYRLLISTRIDSSIAIFAYLWLVYWIFPSFNWGIPKWYSSIFKPKHVAKNIWRVINTIFPICRESMLEFRHDLFLKALRKIVRLWEQIMSLDKNPSTFPHLASQMMHIVYLLFFFLILLFSSYTDKMFDKIWTNLNTTNLMSF